MTEPVDFPAGISAPATRALVAAGYTSIEQLADVPHSEVAALHGMGPKALRIIGEALAERGMSLA